MRRHSRKRLNRPDKAKLVRFGCVLEPAEGTLYILWPNNYVKEATKASVLAEGIYHKSETGRVFCLALEISAVRFLPRYCYWPFDLLNRSQRTTLGRIVSEGVLRCAFDSGAITNTRLIQIPPRQLSRLTALYREAIADCEAFTTAKPNFKKALAELEQAERMPTFFTRVFSESEFRYLEEKVGKDAEKISPERTALAEKFFYDLLEVPRKRYFKDMRSLLESLSTWTGFFQFVSDLYREYGEDYSGIVKTLAAVTVVSSSEEELNESLLLPEMLDSFCELIEQLRSASKVKQTELIPPLVSMLADIRSRLSTGQGISQKFIEVTLAMLGPQVRGKPGRKAGDYSQVHSLRGSNHSWREITKILFESDADLQEEFGVREFSKLRSDQSEHLQHRVEQGYRSYRHRIKRTAIPANVPKPA
jgi:hypothetical protein